MKFSIARVDLEGLLKAILSRGRSTDTLTVSACAGHVFVECNGVVAGMEALVFSDGAVRMPAAGTFRYFLKTYKGSHFLTIEGNSGGLLIKTLWMSVLSYDPHPKPPADFLVFLVTAPPSSTTSPGDRV
jgi:hypothetical protein